MVSPDELRSTMPFAENTGVTIERAGPGEVTGSLTWAPERCTAGGVLHGGALMTLADSVGAACAFLNLPTTATVESGTRFFRAVREGAARAVARPLHAGRSTIVVQVDVYGDDERLVAQTTHVGSRRA